MQQFFCIRVTPGSVFHYVGYTFNLKCAEYFCYTPEYCWQDSYITLWYCNTISWMSVVSLMICTLSICCLFVKPTCKSTLAQNALTHQFWRLSCNFTAVFEFLFREFHNSLRRSYALFSGPQRHIFSGSSPSWWCSRQEAVDLFFFVVSFYPFSLPPASHSNFFPSCIVLPPFPTQPGRSLLSWHTVELPTVTNSLVPCLLVFYWHIPPKRYSCHYCTRYQRNYVAFSTVWKFNYFRFVFFMIPLSCKIWCAMFTLI